MIKVIARRYNIPPDLLAGVAWTEIGGAPQIQDTLAAMARGILGNQEDLANTSVGDVQMQARLIAELRGDDPEALTARDVIRYQRELETNEFANLDLAARHLGELRDQAFGAIPQDELTDDQYKVLAWMFNAGFDQRLADDPARVNHPNFVERSGNGEAVLSRQSRSLKLLGIGKQQ